MSEEKKVGERLSWEEIREQRNEARAALERVREWALAILRDTPDGANRERAFARELLSLLDTHTEGSGDGLSGADDLADEPLASPAESEDGDTDVSPDDPRIHFADAPDPDCPVHGNPTRCPTCGSEEPAWPYPRPLTRAEYEQTKPCPDPFHSPREEEG